MVLAKHPTAKLSALTVIVLGGDSENSTLVPCFSTVHMTLVGLGPRRVESAKQVKVELARSRITRGLSAMVTFMSYSELSIEVEMNSLYGPVSLSVKL